MSLSDNLREHVFADDAAEKLAHYLDKGAFSGAWFQILGGRGDASEVANRFTPADIVAVSTLSVQVTGWAAIALLSTRADELSGLLADIPADVPLHEATNAHLEAVFAAQDALGNIASVWHVTRSKLLARKRPHLVPIRDQHVLAGLLGEGHDGRLTRPLRDALAAEAEVRGRLEKLRTEAGDTTLSLLRVLDIVVWMRVHGANSLAS